MTSETRSRMMASVRQKHTKPEMVVRKILHSTGFRYRLHNKKLAGTPDLILPKYKVAIFVHGCFWHFHEKCKYSKIPTENSSFWNEKFEKNKMRDISKTTQLLRQKWRVLIIWECATRIEPQELLKSMRSFICDPKKTSEIQEIRGNF